MRQFGFLVALCGMAGFAYAGTFGTPEIDANTAGSALALVSGGLLILRARKNKK